MALYDSVLWSSTQKPRIIGDKKNCILLSDYKLTLPKYNINNRKICMQEVITTLLRKPQYKK
jgi:hypothetical protein